MRPLARSTTLVLVGALVVTFSGRVQAQTRPAGSLGGAPTGSAKRARIVGLVIGAGAGFGLGMAAALRAQGATCTDGKVWLTAGSLGGVGAMIGYLAGNRPHREAETEPGFSWTTRQATDRAAADPGSALLIVDTRPTGRPLTDAASKTLARMRSSSR